MIECKLINVQTGEIKYYKFRNETPESMIGRTFEVPEHNKFYYVLNATPLPDFSSANNPTDLLWVSRASDNAYQVIGVTFPHSSTKIYHYFIKRKNWFEIGIKTGTKLIIKTPYGSSDVTVVEPCVEANRSHATKEIEIVRKVGQTPQKTKKVVAVKYIDGKSLSRIYKYELKEPGLTPLINHLYWLGENKSLVLIEDIYTVSNGAESLRLKHFELPTFDIIKNSFKDVDNLEVLRVLRRIKMDNLNCYCKNYIEQIVSGKKPSQLMYPLNNTQEGYATICYSDYIDSISNFTNTLSNGTVYNSNTVFSNMNNKEEDKMNNKGENKTMMNKMMKNLEFGKINTDAIKFSINGLAFKQEDGSYATYDAEKHEFTDVSAFVMDTDFIFAMPVALKDIEKGDIIKHLNRFVIIDGIFPEDGTIKAIDPLAGEEKVIVPIKNVFGFNYYTKIMNIFDGMGMKPDAENPFGNFLPFFLMRDGGFDDTMMLAMMMQNNGTSADFMKNPLMMMALLNK